LFGACLYPALQSSVGNKTPEPSQAQAFSLAANVQMIAGALVSLFNGIIADRFGISSPFFFIGLLGLLISIHYLIFPSSLREGLAP